jgi:hypothetical protein
MRLALILLLTLSTAHAMQPDEFTGTWRISFRQLPQTVVYWTNTTDAGVRIGVTKDGDLAAALQSPGHPLVIALIGPMICLRLEVRRISRNHRHLRGWLEVRTARCDPYPSARLGRFSAHAVRP